MAISPRRKFSAQFKAEAVQMVMQNDRPIAQVAKELEINDGTRGNRVILYREKNPELHRR
ncbi:transposase [Enteractinococcus coprophilus]|uniref:transposase n=1 Tax=Enteractinococcus coprophilus TaxID=1027633 RepID=UPI00114E6AED|nr:transposase [Enteractinococcus coprophilus]